LRLHGRRDISNRSVIRRCKRYRIYFSLLTSPTTNTNSHRDFPCELKLLFYTQSTVTMVDVAANPTRVTGAGDDRNPYRCSASYKDQWRAHLQQQQRSASLDSTIVYDCCCIQLNHLSISQEDVGAWALACTSQGFVYAWKLPSSVALGACSGSIIDNADLVDDEWDDPDNSPASPGSPESPTKSMVLASHQWLVNPHRSALYKLKVVITANASACSANGASASEKVLFFVAGEGCGILAYDVGQLLSFDARRVSPATHVQPLLRYEPYPNPYTSPAIVDFDVNVEANTVTAIAKDDWGLYRWRLDTTHRVPLQIPQRKIEDGPITCFCSLSGSKDQMTYTLVGTGSGILYCLSDRPNDIDAMATDEDGTQAPGPTKVNLRTLLQLPGATIAQVVQVNDCWWTVVGATATNGVGYAATLHAPTQSVVHSVKIRGKPQKVLHCPHRHSLAVLTNSPIVEHRHAISLEVKEKTWTSLKSCHGMGTMPLAAPSTSNADPNAELTVVCGVGKQLDVYRGSTRVMALAIPTYGLLVTPASTITGTHEKAFVTYEYY
jgi:hypothetical protein